MWSSQRWLLLHKDEMLRDKLTCSLYFGVYKDSCCRILYLHFFVFLKPQDMRKTENFCIKKKTDRQTEDCMQIDVKVQKKKKKFSWNKSCNVVHCRKEMPHCFFQIQGIVWGLFSDLERISQISILF